MFFKWMKWLPLIAVSTMLFAAADLPISEEKPSSEQVASPLTDQIQAPVKIEPKIVDSKASISEQTPSTPALKTDSVVLDKPDAVAPVQTPKTESVLVDSKADEKKTEQAVADTKPAETTPVAAQPIAAPQSCNPPECAPQPKPCPKPCAPAPQPCPPKPCAPAPKPCPPKPCAPTPPPCPPKPCPPKPCKPCCVPATLCPLPVCKPPCYNPCCGPMTYVNHNINPTARCTANNNDFFVTADFLWWTANEDETPFAFVNSTIGPRVVTQIGEIANIDYKWKPGFRIGFGWDTCHDYWDLYADWTWYKSSSSSVANAVASVSAGPAGVQVPFLFFAPGTGVKAEGVEAGKARANWRLLYNMIDLELGRSFFVSCTLAMRPYLSVRGGWINRRFSTIYISELVTDRLNLLYNAKSNYWGIGPRVGLNTDWKVGMGFELFGNASGALLYGKNTKNYETAVFATPGASAIFSNISNKKHSWRVVPTAQLNLGLGWGDCFNCNKLYLGIRVGWEVNYYWNLAGFVNQDGNQATYTFGKNIDLAGLTVNVKLDF